ncbi:preprotein translocase subunit SecG [Massilia sp. P8910]|uniref:preprotein translocase subunit SecG n=1 Tax=Massilia antarctica TaxID=2765360 RepID=UPI0006BB959D|nr:MULTISPECIES: preprotein translocase subunit SecG [Massilia]MCE3604489.1 preprotein translocase subunit SecG [Massilia antarctica]MCY0913869.1 preprotein translocase subunit SecG [Massilia sp. H27-R4]CUI04401.1 Preprotein translocase subunit SecG (TC 3.A.5.1.1) [Janthinobacterium sp. CG23_2]CUU28187.1 Preprotein translocase subunit SecG (TC 3.A.5.1.1) [Janthinobacterium sp. CG23_2]
MNTLFNLVVVVQVISALAIIGLVLLQHGKGADMGAAFGSGASGSLFGATGSSNFMSKSTGVAAAVFFGATLGLAFFATKNKNHAGGGVMDRATVTAPAPAPVTGPGAIPSTAPAAPVAAPNAPVTGGAVPAAAPAAATNVPEVPVNPVPK